jgi:hypothetical protein
VQKLSGEAAISLRPADRALRPPTSNLQSKRSTANLNSQNRENQGRAQRPSRRSLLVGLYNPEKFRMECVGKTCSPLTESAACRIILSSSEDPFSGAGEGIRTPDPLITNQMLYRLSYASKFSG